MEIIKTDFPIYCPKPNRTPTSVKSKNFYSEMSKFQNPFKKINFNSMSSDFKNNFEVKNFTEFENEIEKQMDDDTVHTEIISILNSNEESLFPSFSHDQEDFYDKSNMSLEIFLRKETKRNTISNLRCKNENPFFKNLEKNHDEELGIRSHSNPDFYVELKSFFELNSEK